MGSVCRAYVQPRGSSSGTYQRENLYINEYHHCPKFPNTPSAALLDQEDRQAGLCATELVFGVSDIRYEVGAPKSGAEQELTRNKSQGNSERCRRVLKEVKKTEETRKARTAKK